MQKAIYGFSGDPITFGHINIIERALALFGELTVGIGVNPAKKHFFSLEERRDIAENSLRYLPGVKVVAFRGLLVDYAYENNIKAVIRGIRNSEDLDYEMMLHQVGKSQKMNIDTVFFPAHQELMHISSGAAKALQLEQGLIHEYVPLYTKQKLEEKLSGQYIIGVTGEIGAGKSHICQRFREAGKKAGLEVHVIDIDRIGHQILGELSEPLYHNFRLEIAGEFGENLLEKDQLINRKALGQIIFNDRAALQKFNQLIYQPLLLRLRRELYGKRGLILLDSALMAESEMNYLANNNILLVKVDPETQRKRLLDRGYSSLQIKNRLESQYNARLKEEIIRDRMAKDYHGTVWKFDNSETGGEEKIDSLFGSIGDALGLKKEKRES